MAAVTSVKMVSFLISCSAQTISQQVTSQHMLRFNPQPLFVPQSRLILQSLIISVPPPRRLSKSKESGWTKLLGEVEQSSVRFTAAMINNLGQVRKTMGKDQSATHCFQHLLRIVMYTVEAYSQDAYQYYQLPELEKYLNLTSYLVLLENAAAAA
jgi:hypothetical protein